MATLRQARERTKIARVRATSLAGLLLAGVGCEARILVPSENDRLRELVATRTEERDEAVARASELETRLEAALAASRVATGAPSDPEVVEATPALATFAISGLTSARETGGGTALLTLVVAPSDGFGRFIQIVGRLKATVVAVVPGREPLPAATLDLGPKALRDAYRSGFMGTHYTIEIPVAWTGAEPARALGVALEFTDAASGRRFLATSTVQIMPPRPAAAPSPGNGLGDGLPPEGSPQS